MCCSTASCSFSDVTHTCRIAINIPVDLNDSDENLAVLEDLGVKGRFVSIEHLKEYEGGRIIEWRKILCGEFGGLIPRFCVRRSMPEKLAQVTFQILLSVSLINLTRMRNGFYNGS